MSESKKEWKVVDGYYPGFLNIVGASYTVSIVTSATDLTLEDYVNRTNDAHLMAAAPELLQALKDMCEEFRCYDLPYGSAAYAKAITLINNVGKG